MTLDIEAIKADANDHDASPHKLAGHVLELLAARADLVAALGGLIALYAPSDDQRLPPEHPWSIARAALIRAGGVAAVDPREPDPTRNGFWALHNCAGCENGRHPCLTKGGRNYCDGPLARND